MLRNAEFKQPETVRVTLSAPDLVSLLEGGDHDRVDRRTGQRFEARIPRPRVCSRARWGRRRRSGSSAGKHRVGPPRDARRDPRESGLIETRAASSGFLDEGESLLMKPGEIHWIDLATGRRPGIAVSRESLNQGNDVVMVLCTTRRFAIRSKLPNCVPFQTGEFGRSCSVRCWMATTWCVDSATPTSGKRCMNRSTKPGNAVA